MNKGDRGEEWGKMGKNGEEERVLKSKGTRNEM